MQKEKNAQEDIKEVVAQRRIVLSSKLIGIIADEVAKTMVTRLPGMITRPRKKTSSKKTKALEYPIFLDTSAIIDGRIFDMIEIGVLNGTIVVTPSVLLELKHLADSQDMVKRERGRKGLEKLEKLRKGKRIKVVMLSDQEEEPYRQVKIEVDEVLIKTAKAYKAKVVTCDYNLEKKAAIEGITAINMNALANCLKVIAVPGESLHVKISHQGKELTQGVAYLDDGTMIVVENGSMSVGKMIDVVVSRVIQTATGRILFAKRI